MRYILPTLLLLILAGAVSAQRPYTWDQLIEVQEVERTNLTNRQTSEQNLLLQIQESTIKRQTGANLRSTIKLHITEREKLSLRQEAERKLQIERHIHERENYMKAVRPLSDPEVG